MKIYNYLFYKSYLLSQKSGNFKNAPALGGSMFVILCLMFNIFSVFLFLDGINYVKIQFSIEYKYLFTSILVLIVFYYYNFNKRYLKIVNHYTNKGDKLKNVHPILVILFYYFISFGIMLISALFKNKDWIFG